MNPSEAMWSVLGMIGEDDQLARSAGGASLEKMQRA